MQTQTKPSELSYWLALWRTPGIGSVAFARLLEVFPRLEALFRGSQEELKALGLQGAVIAALQNPPWAAVERDLRWAEQSGCHIITWESPFYPNLLKEAAGAPPILFIRGDPNVLALPQMAIVGSRNPTPTGLANARQFATELSEAGFTVTSGLALGIDAAAHQGALEQGGKTIAVLGCGLDFVYPLRHKKLAQHIAEQGAVISEFPIGVSPTAENFPRRNRIVSGMSLGVLVVEATLRSGSLITARLATEQGRDVFAIPGSIHNPLSKGCHALIQQGAKLVESIEDILPEIPAPTPAPSKNPTHPSQNLLAENYIQLLECVGYEATPADILIARTGFSPQQVASMLLQLELQGEITVTPGGYMKEGT